MKAGGWGDTGLQILIIANDIFKCILFYNLIHDNRYSIPLCEWVHVYVCTLYVTLALITENWSTYFEYKKSCVCYNLFTVSTNKMEYVEH